MKLETILENDEVAEIRKKYGQWLLKYVAPRGDPAAGSAHVSECNFKDGLVNCHARVIALKGVNGEIEAPLGEFAGFFIKDSTLTSLKNTPKKVAHDLTFINCTINSFDGLDVKFSQFGTKSVWFIDCKLPEIDMPSLNCTKLSVAECGIKSVEGIHKRLGAIEELDLNGNPLKGSLLDLLKIKGLKKVSCDGDDKSLVKAMKIIRKYLGKGVKGEVECQRELAENDLEDFI